MENIEKTKFIDTVIEALKKSAVEMEKFQVKVALGKAEAKEGYEEIKKKLNLFIHESKYKIDVGKQKVDEINTKLDEFRVQLTLGKAESVEAFNQQKKQLLLTIHELEVKIKTNERLKRMYAIVLIEIEAFKIQLKILEIKLDQGMDKTEFSIEKGKKNFNQFINTLKEKYGKKKETKWEHFQADISEAFNHFRQAANFERFSKT